MRNSQGGVVTEVEILFDKVVENDELLFLAVNDPDSFSEVLQGDIGQRRKNIESRLEPYFDKLVEAAVDEYVKLAPWSPKFQIEALKYLDNKVDEILKTLPKNRLFSGDAQILLTLIILSVKNRYDCTTQ